MIRAGKWRRYHGESFIRHMLDVKTILLNIRDAFKCIYGFFESIRLLRTVRPDAVFIKGGFVGLPVGFAAALLKIPIVTHDSDSLPGLTNRIIGRWARIHATGMPAELYSYPPESTVYTGVPIGNEYTTASAESPRDAKQSLGVRPNELVLLITGGSQGAKRLNGIVAELYSDLLKNYPTLHIFHQVGTNNEYTQDVGNDRLHIMPFINTMHQYMAAADVVIARSSATTITEVGAMQRALIVVPSAVLAGGHQVHNAEYLSRHSAAIHLIEDELVQDPSALQSALDTLLRSESERIRYAQSLHALVRLNAASDVAGLIIGVIKQ